MPMAPFIRPVIAAVLVLFLGGTARAADDLAVRISRIGDTAEVAITFDCPNRLEGQEATTDGTVTAIRLRRLDPCPGSAAAARSASRPAGRELAALAQLEYTSGGGPEARLELRFDRPVKVTVAQAGDLRGLVAEVRVPPGSRPLPPQEVAPVARPAPAPATGPTAEQRARADERARLAAAGRGAPPAPEARYAVNLRSTMAELDVAGEPAAGSVGRDPRYVLYVSDLALDDRTWHRLRLGFFATEEDAEAALATVRASYPDAWVTTVTAAERAGAKPGGAGAAAAALPTVPGPGPVEKDTATTLLADARAAVINREWGKAIELATAALAASDADLAAQARELLGLARERNGEPARAAAEYQQYLADHPAGDGAERVRQRLAALSTARDKPRESVRGSERAAADSEWEFTAGISQYFWMDSLDYGDAAGSVDQSAVFSDANLVLRRSGQRFDFESRATLGHTWDLSGGPYEPGDEARIYNLYADLHDRDLGLSARLGRQTLRNQGVLGRFDGALLSWQFAPDYRVNVVAGLPVYDPADSPESARTFYGASIDVLDLLDLVDVNVFTLVQEVDGISDRQSAGAEVRYFGKGRALAAMVDYDFAYSELNSLIGTGTWTLPNGLTLSGQFDWRKAPYLTTENALIGQSAGSIQDLLLTYTEAEIRQLALDRTGAVQSLALGVSKPISPRFDVSADVTVSSYDATVDSGGVRDTPDSGTLTYSYLSLIGNSLFREGDLSVVGLRYSDSGAFASTALILDTRFPVGRDFRLNPKLLVSRREVSPGDLTELLVRPGIRVLYRAARRFQLELEGGGEFSTTDGAAASNDATGYYLYMGYTADF